MSVRPGGEMAKRPLHFIWILDCSGSMQGDKIQTLNFAIKEAIPGMKDEANQNPTAQLLVRDHVLLGHSVAHLSADRH